MPLNILDGAGSNTALKTEFANGAHTPYHKDIDRPELLEKIGGLTETAPGTDTDSSGLNGRLQRLSQRVTSLINIFNFGTGTVNNALRVNYASDGASVPVFAVNTAFSSSVTFTPAASPYSANDIFEGAKQFVNIGPAGGGHIIIRNTRLRVDANALQASEANYTLQLYSVTPPSALTDNGAWNLVSGDRASYVGSISLGTPVDLGDTLCIEQSNITKIINVPAGGSLFAYLVTSAAFTPTAAARVVTLLVEAA
jgi:hypothetical protein